MAFIDNVAFEGMKVVMNMDVEARGYGRKRPPNGATGVLVSRHRNRVFSARFGRDRSYDEPGVYEQDGTWIVKMDDPDHGNLDFEGMKTGLFFGSGDFDVHGDSKAEYDARAETLWHIPVNKEKSISFTEQERLLSNRLRVGALPETAAWELDTIIVGDDLMKPDDGYSLVVSAVRYANRDRPVIYEVRAYDEHGVDHYSTMLDEKHVASVVRGNLWKLEHGQPLSFRSLEEEATFHGGLGKRTEISNPATDRYFWTLDQVIDAVRVGIIDCITESRMPFTGSHCVSAYRYDDRDLGERLRQKSIAGFDIKDAKPAEEEVSGFKM